MTTLREAAKRLLTAIDIALPHAPPLGEFDFVADAADDLRAALAAPEQEPVAFDWIQAPRKIVWGEGMVSADVAIDRDHTLTMYCEADQTAKVAAMFRLAAEIKEKE